MGRFFKGTKTVNNTHNNYATSVVLEDDALTLEFAYAAITLWEETRGKVDEIAQKCGFKQEAFVNVRNKLVLKLSENSNMSQLIELLSRMHYLTAAQAKKICEKYNIDQKLIDEQPQKILLSTVYYQLYSKEQDLDDLKALGDKPYQKIRQALTSVIYK